MKGNHILLIIALVVCAIVASCKPTTPDDVIGESDFEDILYDYHIANAMAGGTEYGEEKGYNAELNRQAVFKKYGITEAEFDSTLVYYMRHSDKMHKIYKRLSERFDNEASAMGIGGGGADAMANLSSMGDTANVWRDASVAVLMMEAPYNVLNFTVKADTAFHKGRPHRVELSH